MPQQIIANKRQRLFYSYARRDESLCVQLESHLVGLKREGLISDWHHRCILAGSDWKMVVHTQLSKSDIILLLLSPDFIASEYCFEQEVQQALTQHTSRRSRVIPILVRPIEWPVTPFGHLQALPRNLKPVTKWRNRDEAWQSIVQDIRQLMQHVPELGNTDTHLADYRTDNDTIQYKIVITATIDSQNRALLDAIVEHLKKVTSDTEITFLGVKQGSTIIFIKGHRHGYLRLRELFLQGSLKELLGFNIESISISDERKLAESDIIKKEFIEVNAMDQSAVFRDVSMLELIRKLTKLSSNEIPVLLQGETGVGKEIIARALHQLSRRSTAPFVPCNMAAIPEELFESELFGYAPAAFTGASSQGRKGLMESANGGTLYLDEISEMSLSAQAKLLRAIENKSVRPVGSDRERKVDFRIVASSNKDLEQEVNAGRFRKDLFYRLQGGTIFIPPLRQRRRDLYLLAQKFLDEACDGIHRSRVFLSDEARVQLLNYSWPGNIRELKSMMRMAVIDMELDEVVVDPWHLPERVFLGRFNNIQPDLPAELKVHLSVQEKRPRRPSKEDLQALLFKYNSNISAIARELQISHRTVTRWLIYYDLR